MILLDSIMVIPRQELLSSCAEFAESGFAGYIPLELCPLTADLTADLILTSFRPHFDLDRAVPLTVAEQEP